MNRHDYLCRASDFASKGTDRHNAKLDPDKVRLIRSNPKGKTPKQLALDFGVHYRTIEKVIYLETWTHVD